MGETINPVEAKRLREAFKKTEGVAPPDAKTPVADEVVIKAPLGGNPKEDYWLTLSKEGAEIARIEVTPGTLKRLKFEMAWFKRARAGAMSGERFDKGGRSRPR